MRSLPTLRVTLLSCVALVPAWAQSPAWLPSFGGLPGTDDTVKCVAVFDDGHGPAVYVGGDFKQAGGITAIGLAKWDGAAWTAVGDLHTSSVFAPDGQAEALAVFDDGQGPALYVTGDFSSVGGVPANRIARWDGTSWSALGAGIGAVVSETGFALTVFDDGGGPGLYVGGDFTSAGGQAISAVARWDGAAWSSAGDGVFGRVLALSVVDDGSGAALYAGGETTIGDGSNLVRLVGSTWTAVGGGTHGTVRAIAGFDDGQGPALYVTGKFDTAGGTSAKNIARWKQGSWSALGAGLLPDLNLGVQGDALTVFDDGQGAQLYVGGQFGSIGLGLARWDGTAWSSVGAPAGGEVKTLLAAADGGGQRLFVGGALHFLGQTPAVSGVPAWNIGSWDGTTWSALSPGTDAAVRDILTWDDGTGPALFIAGDFNVVQGVLVGGIAKWDGRAWAPVGDGLDTSDGLPSVRSLAIFDDGHGGSTLYIGGRFRLHDGSPQNTARLQHGQWEPLSDFSFGDVNVLTVFDDGQGGGPQLYVGANSIFSEGGVQYLGVARWSGTAWSSVPGLSVLPKVDALVAFDAGGGPQLYAAGKGLHLGSSTYTVVRWNGLAWSPLPGAGLGAEVWSLAVFDAGGGSHLFATGEFAAPKRVAEWTGAAWLGVGGGFDGFGRVLRVIDDGSGPTLFAGGHFQVASGLPAARIARWNGAAWEAMGGGMEGASEVNSAGQPMGDVLAIAQADNAPGGGPAILAGGAFTRAVDSGDAMLARWAVPSAWTNEGGALAGVAGLPVLSGSGTLDEGSSNIITLSNAAPSAPAALFLALSSTPVPFKGGTVLAAPPIALVFFATGAAGTLLLPFTMPAGVPSGTELWLQDGIQDAAAAHGVALSNAIRGLVP